MDRPRAVTIVLLILGALASLGLGFTTISKDCQYARIGVDVWLSFVYLAAVLMIAIEEKANHTVKRAGTYVLMLSGAVQLGIHIATLIRTLELINDGEEEVDKVCVPINAVLVMVASVMLFVGVVILVNVRRK